MASSSSTSANSTSTSTLWDVFLSFRGTDTRSGFISHLHSSLHRTGIKTFIDEPELRAGDVISSELLDAIKQSKTYIVVLSKNYASSTWCLNELVEILECRKLMEERLVLPIFYKIEPSVVRHQIGSFKEAFEKHEGRFPPEILNKWKASLKEVADLSGYHLSDQPIKQTELAASRCELCENRHLRNEADTIDDVVEIVLLQINPVTLEVARYPVGIDSRVEEIESLLRTSSSHHNGVHWIGIYGMGGVGKTTLAKAFYNQMFRSFDGTCFLANIKDVCKVHKGLESLQQQFIDDVLKCKNTTSISSIDRGISLIRERICSLKVLVVLDDLDHRNHVDYLVGKILAVGSVIVLTTRNEDLLDKLGVKTKYMVNILDGVQSQQLFYQHAFGDTVVSSEFIVMSYEIQRYAGGLPLALTVFGSTLSNENKEGWEWFMEKMKRVPVEDIEEKLMISFEALKLVDPILQDIFLDIACFFVGHGEAETVKILRTCYKVLNHYIGLLQKRCLITIQDNKLLMHDLLRDMGRKIARNGSRQNELEKYSRLFASEDIQNMLENKKGTEAIEGMVDTISEEEEDYISYSCDAETFDRMPNLRFLSLSNVKMRGNFGLPFKDLRWLSWYRCDNFPSNFCAEKLVILELPSNRICRFVENALVLENLKILDMSDSFQLSKTPDFNGLMCLETLNLSNCESLVEIDVSIGNLERLATLDLIMCRRLRSLPESICKLRALKTLNLTHCLSLKALPMELGNIESLTDLKADGLSISQLPDSLGRLSKLAVLDLSNNRDLQSIPDTICNLRSLKDLYLTRCPSLKTLPMELRNNESLTNLKADGLNVVGRMIVLKADELNLEAYDCLQCIIDMRSVEILNISCCHSTQLANLQLPSTLKELKAYSCLSLRSLLNLQQLEKINLSVCTSLITELNLDDCKSVQRLPKLSNMQNLKSLWLQGFSSLTEIEDLEKLISIEELHLDDFKSIQELPDLSDFQNLKSLQLKGSSSLTGIQGLEEVISLTRLDLRGCISLKRLSNLSKLLQLCTLQLTDCSSLREIHGLEKVVSITHLDLRGCISLKRLPNLSKLQQLQTLKLTDCSSLTEIEGVEKLISIRGLYLGGCNSIKRLPNLSHLQQLFTLQLNSCSCLTEIQATKRVAYLFKPSISTISVAAASSVEIPDRAVSAVFLSGMNGNAKEANDKSKVWKLIEVIEPSMCRSTEHPDNMRETKISRLIYTNSGNAILALASNAIHLLWKWRRGDTKLCEKATASISPQLWRPSSGILMTNEVTDGNPDDARSCFALSKNDSYLISASGGKISLFNMMTFKTMTAFLPPPPAVTVLAFYPQDNNIIAIGLEDSSIEIYNVRVGEIKIQLNGHSKRITALSFSQVLNVLVSSGADAQLCVWSSDAWELQNARYLQLPDGTIPNVNSDTHVQFHLDQIRFLVVHETQLAIFETAELECLKQWVPQESGAPISYATFSCDSQLIYACFLDASLCVFSSTDLGLRRRISPIAYLPPSVSTSSVHPLVIAAHPKEPNQIAVGLSDGGVCFFEPLEPEDVPPPFENDSASIVSTTTADGASDSDDSASSVSTVGVHTTPSI